MKRIIQIALCLLIWSNVFGQTRSGTPGFSPRSNQTFVPEDGNLSARNSLFVPRYNDTAQASSFILKDTLGAVIFTYNTMTLWVRAGDPKIWVAVGSGGGGGSGTVTSVAWTTSQGVSASIATATTTPNITVTLGALTGVTSLNGLIVTANTGVITTGTWNGTAIGATFGGTGQTVYAVGDLLTANTTTTLSKIAASTNGYVLTANGVGVTPTWQPIPVDNLVVQNPPGAGGDSIWYASGDTLYIRTFNDATIEADGSVSIAGSGGTTIYSGDGVLAGSRVVDGNANGLSFENISNFSVTDGVVNRMFASATQTTIVSPNSSNYVMVSNTSVDINGSLIVASLAGNGVGVVAVDNAGLLSWSAGGGGSGTFIGLTDVPASYAGQALKVVSVNAGETALVFTTLAGGGDALTANPLSQFAATTSAQFAGVISDETGTGLVVLATSPLFTTPRLASTSTIGYVWTATDGSGNGSFQASAGGTPALTQYRLAVGDASNLLSTGAAITGSRALISDANGVPTHATTTATEIGYVNGVTSAIQTQFTGKVGTSGNESISGLKTFAGALLTTGGSFTSNSSLTTSNFSVPASASSTNTSQAEFLFGGAASIDFRVGMRGSTSSTLTVNASYGSLTQGSQTVVEAASGTHAVIAGMVLKPVSITNGTATTTNATTLYITGPPAGTATITNPITSLWIGSGAFRASGDIYIDRTITAGGTTGNQTINLMSGTVNIAAAGTTVTVTNSFVTANSIVHCVLRTNDGTALIKNVVPAAGSFVINLNAAATGEVSIGFLVTN